MARSCPMNRRICPLNLAVWLTTHPLVRTGRRRGRRLGLPPNLVRVLPRRRVHQGGHARAAGPGHSYGLHLLHHPGCHRVAMDVGAGRRHPSRLAGCCGGRVWDGAWREGGGGARDGGDQGAPSQGGGGATTKKYIAKQVTQMQKKGNQHTCRVTAVVGYGMARATHGMNAHNQVVWGCVCARGRPYCNAMRAPTNRPTSRIDGLHVTSLWISSRPTCRSSLSSPGPNNRQFLRLAPADACTKK